MSDGRPTTSVNRGFTVNTHKYILNDFLQSSHVHACLFLLVVVFRLTLSFFLVITSVLLTSNLDISMIELEKKGKESGRKKKELFYNLFMLF
jgi:hypothetical protein